MRKALWITLSVISLLALGVGIAFAWPRGSAQAQSPDQPRGKAFLGVQVATIDEGLSQRLNLPAGDVVVVRVVPNSPAQQAGLQRGDILTQAQIGTTSVALQRPSDLSNLLRNAQPGQLLTLTLQRNGQTQTITVTLGEWPQPAFHPFKGRGKPFFHPFWPGGWDRLVQGQVVLQNGTGTVTYAFFAGTVTSTSTNAIVVTPRDGGAPVTVNLTDEVRVVGCPRRTGADIPTGAQVVVVSQDGTVRWVMVLGPCRRYATSAAEAPKAEQAHPIRILPVVPGSPNKGGPIRIQPVPQEPKPSPKGSGLAGTGV
ncbi:Putative serine protease HtrA [bacterium HR23]|nr:Putative serine protease HtrA [bacterium HR23]